MFHPPKHLVNPEGNHSTHLLETKAKSEGKGRLMLTYFAAKPVITDAVIEKCYWCYCRSNSGRSWYKESLFVMAMNSSSLSIVWVTSNNSKCFHGLVCQNFRLRDKIETFTLNRVCSWRCPRWTPRGAENLVLLSPFRCSSIRIHRGRPV